MKRARWLNLLTDVGVPSGTARQFLDWHEQNPDVWREFEILALELIDSGRKRYGAKAILEVVRFNKTVKTKSEFSVNNNYSAYYARIFAIKYPQHSDFFEQRKIKGLSDKEAA
jgi:hypothetical protein